MTRDELLFHLRDLDLNLRSARVQFFFQNQPPPIRDRFVSFRQEVTVLEGKLTNAQLASIAGKLDELSGDLTAGINNLQGALMALTNTIAILNTLATVVGLAARIAVLAA